MLAIALATLIFGTTFVVIRAVLATTGPWTLLADRFIVAALLGALVLMGLRWRPTRGEWRWGLALGAIAAAMQITNTIGLETTTASKSAFICAGYIALVPVVAFFAMGLVPRRVEALTSVAALSGTLLLTVRWPLDRIVPGDVWTVGTAVTAALAIIATKMAVRHGRSLVLMVIQAAVVAVICAAGAVLGREGFAPQSGVAWLGTLYLGTAASLGAFVLAAHGQRTISPISAAVVFGMEPLVATLFGYLVLGEHLGALQAAGGALMLFAGWAIACDHRRKRAIPTAVPLGAAGRQAADEVVA
ncbi:MAG: EamA family transporter [bacterium]|nr:EamA family transporter [bacterium]